MTQEHSSSADKHKEHVRVLRVFKYAIQHIWRDKVSFFSTLAVMTLMLIICNIIISFSYIGGDLVEYAQKKADFYFEIKDDVNEFQIDAFIQSLKEQPGVAEVHYISKDDALDRFNETFPESGLMSFLHRYDEPNPLPASIGIQTTSLEFQESIVAFLNQPTWNHLFLEQTFSNNTQLTRNKKLLEFSGFLQILGVVVLIVCVSIAILTVFSAVTANLRRRAKEIEIMYLVGANNLTIRLPYIIEGILLAVSAVFIASIFQFIFVSEVFSRAMSTFLDQEIFLVVAGTIELLSSNIVLFVFFEAALLIILAALSSHTAINHYFKKVSVYSV